MDDDLRRAERSDEPLRRVLRDHVTVIDDRHAVAQRLGLVHVVRRQHHRPAGFAEARQDVPQLPA